MYFLKLALFFICFSVLSPFYEEGAAADDISPENMPGTPAYCVQFWSHEHWTFAYSLIDQKSNSPKTIQGTARQNIAKNIIWTKIQKHISAKINSDILKLSWLESEFFRLQEEQEALFLDTIKNLDTQDFVSRSARNAIVLENTQKKLWTNMVLRINIGPFRDHFEYVQFVESYFHSDKYLSLDSIILAISIARKLDAWSRARQAFYHHTWQLQVEKNLPDIEEDDVLRIMNLLIRALNEAGQGYRDTDFITFLKFGFMPKNFLEFDLEERLRIFITSHERERLEFLAERPLTPRVFRNELSTHLAFLSSFGLDVDTTVLDMNESLQAWKVTK